MRCAAGRFACGGYGISLPAKAGQQNNSTICIPLNGQRIVAQDTTVFCRSLETLLDLSEPDARAFDFCRRYTIGNMAYGQLSHFWKSTVLSACHADPAAVHAMLALTAIHRKHDRCTASLMPRLTQTADAHYGKALRHLRNLPGPIDQHYQVVLIVCLILVTCDVLQTRYGAALLHLNNGRHIFQSMRVKKTPSAYLPVLHLPAQINSVEDELTYMMASMDMQSTNYGSLRPIFRLVAEPEIASFQDMAVPPAFASLDDACRHMMIIYNEAARLVPISADPGSPAYLQPHPERIIRQGRLLGQLTEWRRAWENSAFRTPPSSASPEDSLTACRASHLQMLHALAEISIATCVTYGDEMQYDVYLTHFRSIVSIAEQIAPSLPAVTFDVGVVQPLFLLCAYCRHPAIRRRALVVLSGAGKEGYWDSKLTELCSREKMLFEEAAAGYSHDFEQPLSEQVDLATLIPISTRYTETWAFYVDDDMLELDIMFKRRKLRQDQTQLGEDDWEMFSKRIPAPAVEQSELS